MYVRIEDRDDVPVDFDGIRDDDRVLLNAQDALSDAALATARAAVEEEGPVGDQGRAQLIQ